MELKEFEAASTRAEARKCGDSDSLLNKKGSKLHQSSFERIFKITPNEEVACEISFSELRQSIFRHVLRLFSSDTFFTTQPMWIWLCRQLG